MVDEGGIVLLAPTAELERVRRAQREGDEATLRALLDSGSAAALVFGHAMMEHAVSGTLAVRGYGIVLGLDALPISPEARVEACDAALARWIATSDEVREPAPWRGIPLTLFER